MEQDNLLDNLVGIVDDDRDAIAQLAAELAHYRAALREVADALQFYASDKGWVYNSWSLKITPPAIRDAGERARKALKHPLVASLLMLGGDE